MSITGAVAELDKEIAGLNKEVERLTEIRESLLQGASKSAARGSVTVPPVLAKKPGPKRKPGPKKSTAVKKSVAVKKSPPTKTPPPASKRVVSEATRKKMSDAAKARAAKKTSAA
jgi:hypothetical protein